jgi:hypothetical protein
MGLGLIFKFQHKVASELLSSCTISLLAARYSLGPSSRLRFDIVFGYHAWIRQALSRLLRFTV